jgi:hypothetical protein
MKNTNLFFIFSILFCSILSAGTIDPNIPDQKYIEYGQSFKYVVPLCGKTLDNTDYCASAVVIKPKFILTAAHVIKDATTGIITINNKKFKIEYFTYPKEYDSNKFGRYDIAIGKLEEPIELDFYPPLYKDTDESGKVCCISGFGLTGTFNTGAITSDNQRRAGSNIIDGIDRDLLICSPSRNKMKTSLEFIIASGDSGGGLFIDGKLAGINSCVIADKSPKSDYLTESGHTRISKYVDWIEENTEE